jgi:hypothetical protein
MGRRRDNRTLADVGPFRYWHFGQVRRNGADHDRLNAALNSTEKPIGELELRLRCSERMRSQVIFNAAPLGTRRRKVGAEPRRSSQCNFENWRFTRIWSQCTKPAKPAST